MTRHGKVPTTIPPSRGCGMAILDEGVVVSCDRVKWHKGKCSTERQRAIQPKEIR